jgi:hypothetical protein
MDIKTVWFPEFEAGLPRLDGKVSSEPERYTAGAARG